MPISERVTCIINSHFLKGIVIFKRNISFWLQKHNRALPFTYHWTELVTGSSLIARKERGLPVGSGRGGY